MFGKAQILIAAILLAGAVWAESPVPVTDSVFTAFDVETTGFSVKNDRIVEIGAVRFRGNGEILAATNWLIHPGIPIPFYATEVHGITTEMVAGARGFSAIWPEFTVFCRDSILLAHNAQFDVRFLRAELEREGIGIPELPVGDTLPLFRRWFPQAGNYALEPLTLFLGVQSGDYHRAGADALHIIGVFNEGMKTRQTMTMEELERDSGGFERLGGGRN